MFAPDVSTAASLLHRTHAPLVSVGRETKKKKHTQGRQHRLVEISEPEFNGQLIAR